MKAADDGAVPVAPSRDAAISALFTAEASRLTAVAQVLTGDRGAAEDLVQEAFVTLYRRWSWVRDKGAAKDYLMAAVVNGSKLTLRRRYAARNVTRRMQQERRSDVLSAETATLLGENRRHILDALARLPVRQRQVILLRYYAELSEREIAAMLTISRGSVKRHASRALASLTLVLEASS